MEPASSSRVELERFVPTTDQTSNVTETLVRWMDQVLDCELTILTRHFDFDPTQLATLRERLRSVIRSEEHEAIIGPCVTTYRERLQGALLAELRALKWRRESMPLYLEDLRLRSEFFQRAAAWDLVCRMAPQLALSSCQIEMFIGALLEHHGREIDLERLSVVWPTTAILSLNGLDTILRPDQQHALEEQIQASGSSFDYPFVAADESQDFARLIRNECQECVHLRVNSLHEVCDLQPKTKSKLHLASKPAIAAIINCKTEALQMFLAVKRGEVPDRAPINGRDVLSRRTSSMVTNSAVAGHFVKILEKGQRKKLNAEVARQRSLHHRATVMRFAASFASAHSITGNMLEEMSPIFVKRN